MIDLSHLNPFQSFKSSQSVVEQIPAILIVPSLKSWLTETKKTRWLGLQLSSGDHEEKARRISQMLTSTSVSFRISKYSHLLRTSYWGFHFILMCFGVHQKMVLYRKRLRLFRLIAIILSWLMTKSRPALSSVFSSWRKWNLWWENHYTKNQLFQFLITKIPENT